MSSEALDKTVITDNQQFFSKKHFRHFIHHKKILKATKFQFKIICRSRVLDKNIPLWYIVNPHDLRTNPDGNSRTIYSNLFKIFVITVPRIIYVDSCSCSAIVVKNIKIWDTAHIVKINIDGSYKTLNLTSFTTVVFVMALNRL